MVKFEATKSVADPVVAHCLHDQVALAPMSGISDRPFRSAVLYFGRGYAVSEMIASDRLVAGEAAAHLKMEALPGQRHIVQIAGCIPALLADGARIAVESGAEIIDINMGCPAKRVIGGYAGSALMRDLDHAIQIVEAVVAASTVPVTLKMRLGWDENHLNAPELARRAQDCGVQLVTVHGRTRQQFYKGKANWAEVGKVREVITIPLVVNGDIVDGATAAEALTLSGADAVMVGRAALGKPWLLAEIAAGLKQESFTPPDLMRQFSALIGLYRDILTHYGLETGKRHARKHLAAALDVALATVGVSTDVIAQARQEVLTSHDPDHVEDKLTEIQQVLSMRRAA